MTDESIPEEELKKYGIPMDCDLFGDVSGKIRSNSLSGLEWIQTYGNQQSHDPENFSYELSIPKWGDIEVHTGLKLKPWLAIELDRRFGYQRAIPIKEILLTEETHNSEKSRYYFQSTYDEETKGIFKKQFDIAPFDIAVDIVQAFDGNFTRDFMENFDGFFSILPRLADSHQEKLETLIRKAREAHDEGKLDHYYNTEW